VNSFRISHLSDLHLTAKDNAARSEPKLFGALTGMNANFRRIVASRVIQESDLVLVTGDITDRGDIGAWQCFWDTVEAAKIKDRVRVVPGNHDVCCLGARLPLARNQYREEDMAKVRKGLLMGGQPTKFPWAYSPDPRVVVFGLNSNNLGNFTAATNAMGDIGYYQLKDLASLLYKHRDVPVKIIAMHHSPNIPEEETAIKRGQRPFSQLERIGHQVPEEQRRMLNLLCVTHKVRLLLHGHLHMTEDRRITGVRYIGATASTEPQPGPQGPVLRFPTYQVSAKTHRVSRKSAMVPV
jgi:3',5'-cyclic AMP phosphodiesterase CpdA